MTSRTLKVSCGLLLLTLSACQTTKSSSPTAPTIAGPIAGVTISAPVLLEPAQGFKFKESEQPIKLVVQNATTSGVRALTYTFEVAGDAGFSQKVFSRSSVAPGDGKTSVTIDRLELGRTYYWRAWAADGANTGTIAAAGFEIYPQASVSAPVAQSPGNNELTASTTVTLVAGNSATVGPVASLGYTFQLATDQAFTKVLGSAVVAQGGGQTTFTASALPTSATIYWRVRASDGETTSAWSATQVFRTPAPTPPPPGPPAPGGPCAGTSALAIITCERSKYGHMSATDTVNFLISSTHSLASNGIGGGPFGLLRKTGGSSCNGYSCDIICSGSGSSQKQWDVLGDAEGAQTPAWNGPSTVPNIRIDTCDIK